MIQVMGFRIHIVVYGKKRGGDKHPAAQFFIYYNLLLLLKLLKCQNVNKGFLRGEGGEAFT